MTDATGEGQAEPRPAPQTPPHFGTPTPGSVLPGADPAPGQGQTSYGQPSYGQTSYGQPSYGPPAYGPPAYGQPGNVPAGYRQPGQPGALSPSEERTWGMLAHLSALIAGFFGFAFLGPLVVYLMFKNRSAFVRLHATESLNFQISLIIYSAVGIVAGIVLSLVTFGLALIVLIPLAIIAVIAAVIFTIMGCVAGNNGREFRYPLTLRFVN